MLISIFFFKNMSSEVANMVENYNFSTLSIFQQPFTVTIETMKDK